MTTEPSIEMLTAQTHLVEAQTAHVDAQTNHERQLTARAEARASVWTAWSNTADKLVEAGGLALLAAVVAAVPLFLIERVYRYNSDPGVLAVYKTIETLKVADERLRTSVYQAVKAATEQTPPAPVSSTK